MLARVACYCCYDVASAASRLRLCCSTPDRCRYAGLASAGYWSKGLNVADIVIFSLGESPLARLAAGCILIQALAQYLVNLNVW